MLYVSLRLHIIFESKIYPSLSLNQYLLFTEILDEGSSDEDEGSGSGSESDSEDSDQENEGRVQRR